MRSRTSISFRKPVSDALAWAYRDEDAGGVLPIIVSLKQLCMCFAFVDPRRKNPNDGLMLPSSIPMFFVLLLFTRCRGCVACIASTMRENHDGFSILLFSFTWQ